MTRVAVVSTSINSNPTAYAKWAKEAHLIVAGDHNTPVETAHYVRGLGGIYLDPTEQGRWAWSESIGWRCVQRRNAAFMHAYELGYDYVISVDDDNHPEPDGYEFMRGHILNMETQRNGVHHTIGTLSNFLNTGVFCRPQFHQRGTPYGVTTNNPVVQHIGDGRPAPRIVVSQAQVLGDPDCDAIERLCNEPKVEYVVANAVVSPGTYAAFNSQATVWARDWLPVAAVLPHIGRYDDIFASFIFARLARERNVALFVGEPCVRQVRNPHDLIRDLREELWGMNHVFDFTGALTAAHVSADMPLWMAYEELIIATSNVLPSRTVEFAKRWTRTWREIG